MQAFCPICNSVSNRVHSNYQRSLLDVSWGNYQVCLKLSTRKLFCSNSDCKRRIFTQRLPKIVAPWSRRTERLNIQLTKVGLAQGGLPGSRLTQHFEGSYVTLARYTHRLREAQGLKPREKPSKPLPLVFEPKKSLMTVCQAVWLILRHSINQSEAETEAIELLKKQHPELDTGISLAMDFADLVRRKQLDNLAQWLEKAENSGIRAITGFASKLKDDLDAVRNGITYEWSNGQVEGQVNRLKMLKRQMYGRASHELLKKRFLCPI